MAAAYNDFIFAIIVEEYGLIFGAGVIFLYLIFFFRGIIIVRRSRRTFPAFVVIGLTLVMVYQAMINIGVSSGVLPVTGQPTAPCRQRQMMPPSRPMPGQPSKQI